MSLPDAFVSFTIENTTNKAQNTCVALLSDEPLQIKHDTLEISCESGKTRRGERDSCYAYKCWRMIPGAGGDAALIKADLTINSVDGSRGSCDSPTFGMKNGFNDTQYLEVCVSGNVWSEEAGYFETGDSGKLRCVYDVQYLSVGSVTIEQE